MALGASILYSSDGPIMENTHNSQSKQKSLKYRKTNQPKLSASPLLLMQRNYQRRLLEEKEKKLAELCRKREEEALRHVAQNCSKDVKHYFQQTHNDTTLRESTWSSNSQRTKKLPPIKFTENKSRSFHGDAETNDSDDFSRRPNVGEKGKRRKLKGFSVGHTVFENGTTSIKRFDGSDGGTLQPQNKENEDTMLPDMTNLKSKILARKRQLQKVNKRHANLESSNLDANASDDQKLVTAQRTLTDFQKWQMQQDMERTERLKNHALKNMRSPRNQLESEESVSDSTSTAGFSKPHQNSRSRRKPSNQGLAGAKKAPGNHPQASHRQFANKESVHNQGKETSHALGAQDAVKGETNEGTEQIRLDLTYSKQHGLSEQMRAFRNNNRIKESRQNEHLQSMAGFHKPVLVRHDSHSTGSSRTSTRTGISPQVATQDRHANDKKYEENWKGPVQTRETDYGNDNVRVGEKLGMFTESEYEKVVLVPCNVCGRKFKADRLAKHKSVCTKMAGKKRKVYNMENARRKGTDLEQFRIVKGSSRDPPVQAAKNNWKLRHEDFLNTIRHVKEASAYLAKGGNLADLPPPPPSLNPDYVQCPHCERRFAPKAAERHIPKCKETKSRPPPPKKKLPARK